MRKSSVQKSLYFFLFLLLGGSLSWLEYAQANVGDAFGFGSRTTGLAGAAVGAKLDAFSVYHNPAALALIHTEHPDQKLIFSYGLIWVHPNFTPISNVVVENSVTSDKAAGSPRYGDIDVDYRNTFGQQLAAAYRVLPDWYNLTVGVVAFLPLEQLAYMDTGEAYQPEYVLYRARTQRPQVEIGIGANMGNGFYLGLGIHTAFSVTANGTAFMNANSNTISSMRFATSLKPKMAPYLGVFYTPVDQPSRYSLGAVFRFPATFDNVVNIRSSARILGPAASVDFQFPATSALYYDPMTMEIGGSFQQSSWGRTYLQLDYQAWSQFQSPALLIGTNSGGTQMNPGRVPSYDYVNIFVPRVGEEIAINEVSTLRFGYAYKPSMMKDAPTGEGNYLDPPKHMLNLGLGLQYKKFPGIESPWRVDFNLTYHLLVSQHIVKTAGNELGDMTDKKIGSDAYDAGGNQFGGGITLTLGL